MKKKVGIWIRVSTEDQARGESPEHHEMRARMYAEVKGWEVAEVYHLEGVSGKAVMKSEEAHRMLRDIREKRIQALIFSKLARLARNTKQPSRPAGSPVPEEPAANGVRQHPWPFGNMPPVEGMTRGDMKPIIAYIRELQRANGIN